MEEKGSAASSGSHNHGSFTGCLLSFSQHCIQPTADAADPCAADVVDVADVADVVDHNHVNMLLSFSQH